MCDTKKNSNKLRLRIINRNLLLQLSVALVFFLQYVVGCDVSIFCIFSIISEGY
jgi:hypothetical protein